MPRPAFSINVRPSRAELVFEIRGDVDLATAPEVRDAVLGAVDDGWRSLVLDLRAVEFMDSQGVHLLHDLAGLEADGVQCGVIQGGPGVTRVLELAGAPGVLPVLEPGTV